MKKYILVTEEAKEDGDRERVEGHGARLDLLSNDVRELVSGERCE